MEKKEHLYKLVVNKNTGKVELDTWFADRNNAYKECRRLNIKEFITVRNSDKALRLGNITQVELDKILSKVCNNGKGVTDSQFEKIVQSGEYLSLIHI